MLKISAVSSPQYYGHFARELVNRFGRARLVPPGEFPALTGPRDGMYAILRDGRRLFFSTDDHPVINEAALEWCDAYGMVNLLSEHLSLRGAEKLVALGPSFGDRWVPQRSGLRFVLGASLHDRNQFASGVARLRSFLKHQRERTPLAGYRHGESVDDYVFFVSTYWQQHPEANELRLQVWRSLASDPTWRREGGFVGASDCDLESNMRCDRRYTHQEFLEHTRRSCVAINTNAVHGCMGWKLGEYLALGKAIVTEPIRHVLPASLDETRVVTAESPEAMVEACQRLRHDPALRRSLEREARRYFEDFVSPQAAIDRLARTASS